MIGSFLSETLKDFGYDVCGIASSEAEAVNAALRLRPDLMLVDARLASGSGISAVAEILKHYPVRHVFMSGERLPASLGAPTLMKPFRDQDLASALQKAVNGPVPG